jgi:hypothetical protein
VQPDGRSLKFDVKRRPALKGCATKILVIQGFTEHEGQREIGFARHLDRAADRRAEYEAMLDADFDAEVRQDAGRCDRSAACSVTRNGGFELRQLIVPSELTA